MGVGINEASKLGGAIAAVGVASRMIGEEKNQALQQGAAAATANAEDSKRAKELPDEIDNADLYLKEETRAAEAAKAYAENPNNKLGMRLAAADFHVEKLKSIDAAKIALENLQDEQTAISERLERQEAAMARGRRWGGSY